MTEKERLTLLFENYLNGNLSRQELEELLSLAESKDQEELTIVLKNVWSATTADQNPFTDAEAGQLLDRVLRGAQTKKTGTTRIFKLVLSLAAILLVAIVTTLFSPIFNSQNSEVANSVKTNTIDLKPGGNKALLVLSDGSAIVLDTARNGELIKEANTTVIKKENGELAYNTGKNKQSEILYNTISTPRGGEYKLTLPDQSVVYLNAASSIRFPIEFVGNQREVEITGEAYFEVSKDQKRPFRVKAREMTIEVLGTHFNVNAYIEEGKISTTLLEGSVIVNKGMSKVTLLPGEQAQSFDNDEIKILSNVNTDEVTAWKEGWFEFNSASIESIMNQVSRWYDVEISYEGEKTSDTFSGIVSRRSNVSDLLKIMESAGIRFTIEKNKITVKNREHKD